MSVTEQEIQAITVAPRVTKDDVLDAIAKEEFLYTATLTFCVLTLVNGWTVTGESACASPANYNKEIGDRLAKDNAISKIWGFLGFSLKEKLHILSGASPASADMLEHGEPKLYLYVPKTCHAIPMTYGEYCKISDQPLSPHDIYPAETNGYLVEFPYVDHRGSEVKTQIFREQARFEKTVEFGIRAPAPTFLDRMKAEHTELHERYEKLAAFAVSPTFSNLPQIEQDDLLEQRDCMLQYSKVLFKRIKRNSQ